jgi:hypothetical protein
MSETIISREIMPATLSAGSEWKRKTRWVRHLAPKRTLSVSLKTKSWIQGQSAVSGTDRDLGRIFKTVPKLPIQSLRVFLCRNNTRG